VKKIGIPLASMKKNPLHCMAFNDCHIAEIISARLLANMNYSDAISSRLLLEEMAS